VAAMLHRSNPGLYAALHNGERPTHQPPEPGP
jgi:hypothetical protein